MCVNNNDTYYVSSLQNTASVEITPDTFIQLPVGSFSYNISGCVMSVHIINNGKCSVYVLTRIFVISSLTLVQMMLTDV